MSGQYYDNDAGNNDAGTSDSPHPDALEVEKSAAVVRAIEALLQKRGVG